MKITTSNDFTFSQWICIEIVIDSRHTHKQTNKNTHTHPFINKVRTQSNCVSILWKHLDNLALKQAMERYFTWAFGILINKNTSKKKPLKYRFNCKFACQRHKHRNTQPHHWQCSVKCSFIWRCDLYFRFVFRNVVFKLLIWNWVNLEWHSFWKPRKINRNAWCVCVLSVYIFSAFYTDEVVL